MFGGLLISQRTFQRTSITVMETRTYLLAKVRPEYKLSNIVSSGILRLDNLDVAFWPSFLFAQDWLMNTSSLWEPATRALPRAIRSRIIALHVPRSPLRSQPQLFERKERLLYITL